MICECCGRVAPTKYVAFYQNIGALIVRFTSSVEGNLCKACIHEHFWKCTGITLVGGWWGTISFIVTPFILGNNVVRYLFCLGLPREHPPEEMALDSASFERLKPHCDALLTRWRNEELTKDVVEYYANKAGVSPAQVLLFTQLVVDQARGRRPGQEA